LAVNPRYPAFLDAEHIFLFISEDPQADRRAVASAVMNQRLAGPLPGEQFNSVHFNNETSLIFLSHAGLEANGPEAHAKLLEWLDVELTWAKSDLGADPAFPSYDYAIHEDVIRDLMQIKDRFTRGAATLATALDGRMLAQHRIAFKEVDRAARAETGELREVHLVSWDWHADVLRKAGDKLPERPQVARRV
jgi:hypothetical protein